MEFLSTAWAHREEIGAWLLAALVASTALIAVSQVLTKLGLSLDSTLFFMMGDRKSVV